MTAPRSSLSPSAAEAAVPGLRIPLSVVFDGWSGGGGGGGWREKGGERAGWGWGERRGRRGQMI